MLDLSDKTTEISIHRTGQLLTAECKLECVFDSADCLDLSPSAAKQLVKTRLKQKIDEV